MRLYIGTHREIGEKCKAWAKDNLPNGWEYTDEMDSCDVFISVLYDALLKPEFIEKHRCYNFHPGILPWYRGSGAFSWAIINGEIETGITLHKIDGSIDTGPVIRIGRFSIHDKDTAESLYHRAENVILYMFKKWFLELLDGNPTTHHQVQGITYYRKDLDKAKDLTRFVKAFTFKGKDNCYYINSKGEKIELVL